MQSGKNNLTAVMQRTIEEHSLISSGDKVLVGLSGGADSMCLTYALCALAKHLKIEVAAAHLNHNIRGEAAVSDAEAARQFALRLDIPFFYRSEDVCKYAEEHSLSEELAGRELRYRFFDDLCSKHGFTKIATAHNRNDNAETLIMNFIRGSAISGLCGIPYRRGAVIRPLLDISREEIEGFCKENDLPYVTDKTNLEAIYTRNRVRIELIPELQRYFNPNIINTLTSNARLISEENDFIEQETEKALAKVYTESKASAALIGSLHPAIARRAVMRILEDNIGSLADVGSKTVEDVLDLCRRGMTGKRINIPRGYTAEVRYGVLLIRRPADEPHEFYVKPELNSDVYIPEAELTVRIELCEEVKNDKAVYLSCDDVSGIVIRSRRAGDIFYPVGMSGRKKLKEFFIDMKLPSDERMKVPVIEVGGEIAAVADLRTDRRYIFGKNGTGFKVILGR